VTAIADGVQSEAPQKRLDRAARLSAVASPRSAPPPSGSPASTGTQHGRVLSVPQHALNVSDIHTALPELERHPVPRPITVAETQSSGATALRRYDSEPVIQYWKRSRRLAKADENRASYRENSAGASGEVDLDNGGSDAVILDDPERARLSE